MSLSLTTEVQTWLTLTKMIQLISIDWYYCIHLSKAIMIGSCPLVNPRSVSLWLTGVWILFLSISILLCLYGDICDFLDQSDIEIITYFKRCTPFNFCFEPWKINIDEKSVSQDLYNQGQGIWKQTQMNKAVYESLLYWLLYFHNLILISLCPVCDNVATRISA